MFIAGFDKEKQAAFLNLAYTMVYADGRLDEKEQMIFAGYQIEVEADMSKVHTVDFNEELSAFDDCTRTEKQRIFFELYALALIDDAYPEEEQKLVETVKKRFDISDEKAEEMKTALMSFISVYNNLHRIVTT